MISRYYNPAQRREELLCAMLDIARREGYATITRERIAEVAGVSPALISHYFGDVPAIRELIALEAIKRDIPEIVAHGLTFGDPIALNAPKTLKHKAAESLYAK